MMKKLSAAVAYPTIPIIFLGGINPNRSPIYDTMGLAVTSHNETTRTETVVESLQLRKESVKNGAESQIEFSLGGKPIKGKRGEQILAAVKSFMKINDVEKNLAINSNNYEIFSGSSDAGLAALFTALNDFFELNLSKEELLKFAMKGSESAGRSLYGGLTQTIVQTKPPTVVQLASEEELAEMRLFSVPFNYESRISADEIHAGIVRNPKFPERVTKIPIWVKRIKKFLEKDDLIGVLETAEENIRNAHELLEGVGLNVRKPEMMALCQKVENMRKQDILAYFLIGGGNLITVATTKTYAEAVEKYLTKDGWTFQQFKVAGGPKIIRSE